MPRIDRGNWRDLFALSLIGAFIAGFYGVVHDQVTYSISPEYFTKAKFEQFAYADPGRGPRVFAGVVGFLASWWVGAIGAWLLGRVALPRAERRDALRHVAKGLGAVFCGAASGGLAGWWFARAADLERWRWLERDLDIAGLEEFVTVACIHNGGYAGALIGFIIAVAVIRGGTDSAKSETRERPT